MTAPAPVHRWSAVIGNCNDRLPTADDGWIRCTAIEGHAGLHRAHYESGTDEWRNVAVAIWGDDPAAVSIEALAGTDPLALRSPLHPLLRFFDYEHLPRGTLRDTSRRLHSIAHFLAGDLPDGAEKTAGLRKLLEAKDCFVRAALPVRIDTAASGPDS